MSRGFFPTRVFQKMNLKFTDTTSIENNLKPTAMITYKGIGGQCDHHDLYGRIIEILTNLRKPGYQDDPSQRKKGLQKSIWRERKDNNVRTPVSNIRG